MHVIEAVCNASDEKGNNRASDIAQSLHISAGTLTTQATLLEKKGCLKRKQDSHDRRIVRLYATEKGRRANKAHQAFHQQMVSDVINALTPDEADCLVKALKSLESFLYEK